MKKKMQLTLRQSRRQRHICKLSLAPPACLGRGLINTLIFRRGLSNDNPPSCAKKKPSPTRKVIGRMQFIRGTTAVRIPVRQIARAQNDCCAQKRANKRVKIAELRQNQLDAEVLCAFGQFDMLLSFTLGARTDARIRAAV